MNINWKREFQIHATKWQAIQCLANTIKEDIHDMLLTSKGIRK